MIVNKSELKAAIEAPCKVAARASADYMACLLVKAEGDRASFEATDGDTSVATSAMVLVEEEGEALISGKMLRSIVAALPEAAVSIVADAHFAEVSCGKSCLTVPCLDPSIFPKFPDMATGDHICLHASVYEASVLRAVPFASKEEARIELRQVRIEASDQQVRAVATDSYGLVEASRGMEMRQDYVFSATVPATFLRDIPTAMQVELYVDESRVKAVVGDTTYITRKLAGTFPKAVDKLLSSESEAHADLKRSDLLGAVKLAEAIAPKDRAIKLTVGDGRIGVDLEDADGVAMSDEVEATCDGEGVVYVAPALLERALNALDDRDITLSIRSAIDPIHLIDDYVHAIVMPVRRPS